MTKKAKLYIHNNALKLLSNKDLLVLLSQDIIELGDNGVDVTNNRSGIGSIKF